MTAARIKDPEAANGGKQFWDTVDTRLKTAGVSREQVQAAWIKQADAGPSSGFPKYAQTLRDELRQIVQLMKVRFPNLKLAYSEGQIGWIPYILERADTVWEEHRAWAHTQDLVPEPPSTYYHRQIYGCFFRDQHGLASLDEVGVDNITFETDYPHTDSTWPHTKEVAEKMFAGLDDDTIYKIVRGNAIRMLSLDIT